LFYFVMFFFTFRATTEISPLSLHDALPISSAWSTRWPCRPAPLAATSSSSGCSRCPCSPSSPSRPTSSPWCSTWLLLGRSAWWRSEEHTSELQSRSDLVCRLLLEKKKYNRH